VAIADALKINTSLTNINLRENNIYNNGGQAIANALENNTSLTKIDLSNNCIFSLQIQIALGKKPEIHVIL
jgi:hypothetical protein